MLASSSLVVSSSFSTSCYSLHSPLPRVVGSATPMYRSGTPTISSRSTEASSKDWTAVPRTRGIRYTVSDSPGC